MRMLKAIRPLVLLVALGGASCGAPATLGEPPMAPEAVPGFSVDSRSEMEDLRAFEQQLAQAEGALQQHLALMAPTPAGTEAQEPVAQPQAPAAGAARSAPSPRAELREARAAPAPSPCEVACRALASMRRAADGICRLTDSADAHCTRARERVAQAEQRVTASDCSCERQPSP